jgi:hypothetical protein
MRKVLFTVLILIFLATMVVASPKISIPQISWDYGNVPQNTALEHDYLVKNIGTDTLRIISVKPG